MWTHRGLLMWTRHGPLLWTRHGNRIGSLLMWTAHGRRIGTLVVEHHHPHQAFMSRKLTSVNVPIIKPWWLPTNLQWTPTDTVSPSTQETEGVKQGADPHTLPMPQDSSCHYQVRPLRNGSAVSGRHEFFRTIRWSSALTPSTTTADESAHCQWYLRAGWLHSSAGPRRILEPTSEVHTSILRRIAG